MIVRTTDTILVSEEQLAAAVALVEETCQEFGVVPEIEVTLYVDPEDESECPLTMVLAHIRRKPGPGKYQDLIPEVGDRLRAAGLLEPRLPLTYHLRPEW